MTEQKLSIDSAENIELISELYSNSKKEQPPEFLDVKILEEAHQAVTTKKKQFLSTTWKAGLSMAAVLIVGLAVVLEVGVVTHDKDVFEKPVIQEALEGDAMDNAGATVEAASGLAESNAAPVKAERSLKPRVMPFAAKRKAPEAERPLFNKRNKIADEVEATTEGQVLQQEAAQELSGSSNIKMVRPERWIIKIQKLIEQGEEQQAAQEIKKFSFYYPDVDLTALGIIVAPAAD